jgi:hypothetical protein
MNRTTKNRHTLKLFNNPERKPNRVFRDWKQVVAKVKRIGIERYPKIKEVWGYKNPENEYPD